MKQIYLARHGDTTAQAREYESIGQLLVDLHRPDFGDEPLTERGKEQALILARSIKETFKPDGYYYLFTSDTRRCGEMGEILANELGIWAGGGDSMWFMPPQIGPRRDISEAELGDIAQLYENHPYAKHSDKVTFHGAIFVTHHNIIPPLARFIARKNAFSQIPEIQRIQTGQAVYLDLENRMYRMLPQSLGS